MAAARATAARDAATHGMPVKPVGAMSNWEIFKSAFHRDNPLHQHNRRWGGAHATRELMLFALATRADVALHARPPAGLLLATAGLAYLIKRAEEIQREMATEANASSARSAAAAHTGHAQHSQPPLPRK